MPYTGWKKPNEIDDRFEKELRAAAAKNARYGPPDSPLTDMSDGALKKLGKEVGMLMSPDLSPTKGKGKGRGRKKRVDSGVDLVGLGLSNVAADATTLPKPTDSGSPEPGSTSDPSLVVVESNVRGTGGESPLFRRSIRTRNPVKK